ncbi:hypothetical protein [Kitasatospora sp. NPDC088134]|uniref:hypothetical protein n=1 Tax=Kitasatospora sp. NPDC088134 TaxID=3364071 RepID=UPI00381BF75B
MDEESCLERYGLRPAGAELAEVRALLAEYTARERRAQGDGDTELMTLCCVQLFNSGTLDDVLLIWRAKGASFDAACSVDLELLLGHGLPATLAHLAAHPAPDAATALARLREAEQQGELAGFSVAAYAAARDAYYADMED